MISINPKASLTALNIVGFSTRLCSSFFSIAKISFVAVLYKITMPAKRKNTGKQAKNGKAKQAKQAKQDGQKAISHDIDVPIDEGFKEGKLWAVPYIDCQDGTFNQVAGNSSKVPYMLMRLSHRRCQSLH